MTDEENSRCDGDEQTDSCEGFLRDDNASNDDPAELASNQESPQCSDSDGQTCDFSHGTVAPPFYQWAKETGEVAATTEGNADVAEADMHAESSWNDVGTDVCDDELDFAGTTTNVLNASSAQDEMCSGEWDESSAAGLSSALNVLERRVSGYGEPFTREQDADFEVIEELARGGLGVIYIARQTSLDRILAIKTLRLPDIPEWSHGDSRITRLQREYFLAEALVTANLVHPGIVPIHDLCRTREGIPFYTMQRVRGVSWVRAAGYMGRTRADIQSDPIRTMGLDENLEILLKVCDVTAYAHSQGVVNRDLKPENVIIGDFGEVIVLDWGLAVFTPDSGRQNHESSTISFGAGTAAYMAPELWNGPGEAIGPWSDIYLLGGILFEILTGHAPHKFEIPRNMPKNPTPEERQQMKIDQINDVVGNNRIRETDIRGELMEIAMKAMQTDPNDRWQSVQEFQAAIREYQCHAASRHLSQRADQLMDGQTLAMKKDYQDYQTAAAFYEEALHGWAGNHDAKEGLYRARLENANLAYQRGDYDLGLQLVAADQNAGEYVALRKKLQKAKNRRAAQRRISWLTGMFMIGAPLAAVLYFQNQQYRQLLVEHTRAVVSEAAAREEAKEMRRLMDTAAQETDAAQENAEAGTQ